MWNNANVISCSNLDNRDDNLEYQIRKISTDILDILASIMGPHATFVAIPNVSSLGKQTSTEFTKDGIGTISNISYTNDQIANSILSSVEHIGKRIDTKCHDGTTSSMYMFVYLLQELRKLINEPKLDIKSRPLAFKYALNNTFEFLNLMLKKNTVTIEKISEDLEKPLVDVRAHVAYTQSLVSTKGSHRLSRAVSEYIKNSPVEDLYTFTTLKHVLIEDEDKDIELHIKDYDIEVPIIKMDESINNYLYNTEYKNNVDLLPIEESLIRGNEKTKEIEKEIDECIEILNQENIVYDESQVFIREDKDLFIVCLNNSKDIDEKINILNDLLKFHNKKGRVRISIIKKRNAEDFINLHKTYIRAIRLMSDVNVYDCLKHYFRDSLVYNTNIKIIDSNLYIEYNKEKSNDLYSSKYLTEKKLDNETLYGRLVKEVKAILDKSISSRNEKLFNNAELSAYNDILKSLISEKNATIYMGGTSHSIQMDMSAIQDAIGSSISSIKDGVIYGGISRFYAILENKVSNTENITDIEKEILIIFKNAFESMIKIIYREYASDIIFENNTDLRDRFIRQYGDIYFSEYYHIDPMTQESAIIENNKELYTLDRTNNISISPSIMFKEIFYRLQEILPSYIVTRNYITK